MVLLMRVGSQVIDENLQSGFTYLGILLIVFVIAIGMSATSQVWHTFMQRQNEQELIYIGNQFRTAIGKYYNVTGGQYPINLDVLLGPDDQQTAKNRFLRKIFNDPMTQKKDWVLIYGKAGQVIGVHSASEDIPFKKSGFAPEDIGLENKEHYSEWMFVFTPKLNQLGNSPTMVNGIVRPMPRVN